MRYFIGPSDGNTVVRSLVYTSYDEVCWVDMLLAYQIIETNNKMLLAQ